MNHQSIHKKRIGIVVSNKMDKTAVVEVRRRVCHPLFNKYFVKRKKFKAHDSSNTCQLGDRVLIQECRPISRTKRWTVVRVMKSKAA